MKNLRIYGAEPYDLALIHGGPGAPGSMSGIAGRLSISFGILEPLILTASVDHQIEELQSIVTKHTISPLFFIGHSWGAWLCLLYASEYPELVKKIILIGAPPFDENQTHRINENRMSRLNKKEREEYRLCESQLTDTTLKIKNLSVEYVNLLAITDVFEMLPNQSLQTEFSPIVYKSVWDEASNMRRTGILLEKIKKIKCPVVAIHSDYDPHPADGVCDPLKEVLPNFRFNLIEKCGHYPWIEKYGKDILYKILYKEMGSTCV